MLIPVQGLFIKKPSLKKLFMNCQIEYLYHCRHLLMKTNYKGNHNFVTSIKVVLVAKSCV